MSAIDYISAGNPANQKPPIGAPAQAALCLDVESAALYAAIGGRWTEIGTTTFANVVSFGADATGHRDALPAIQAALLSLPNGGVVYFPLGIYKVSAPITLTRSNITLLGVSTGHDGAALDGSRIVAMNSLVSPILQIVGTANQSVAEVVLRNINIEGVYSAAQTGLYCNYFSGIMLDNVQFNLCGQAENIDSGFRIIHNNVIYTNCGSGDTAATATVRVQNQSNPLQVTTEQIFFSGCVWSGDQVHKIQQGLGLYIGPAVAQTYISGCKFDYTTASFSARVLVLDQTTLVNIYGNFLASGSPTSSPTGSSVIAISGVDAESGACAGISIVNNFIQGWTSTIGIAAGSYAYHVSIFGNTVDGSGSGEAISVAALASDVQAVGNAFPAGDMPWTNSSSTSGMIGPPSIASSFAFSNGLSMAGAAPTVTSGQVGLGSTTSATANAGAATLPAAPVGFLIVNVGGTNYKLPYYAT